MRFPTFEMERMQSTWEHRVRYDLSESGVEPLTLGETLELVGRDIGDLRLGYADGRGRDATRAQVARIHRGATADQILVTTGTSEANFLVVTTLVERGDEVVVVLPSYMQVHGLARGIGASVREVWLEEERGWTLDHDRLSAAITARTKLICLCTPNNPTGQILSASDLDAVARLAERVGAWVLCDEVYRGTEHDGVESASMWGRCERVVVTGGLSKAYGLPGLRIGWIVAPPERIEAAWAQKDYTTIATATISEALAEAALGCRDALLARTRRLLVERWPALEKWAVAHDGKLRWARPRAGAISFFGYAYGVDSWPFVERLIQERGTMVVPGSQLLVERHLRIGFGGPPAKLRAGLAEIDAAIASLS
ncbi:MAG: aminotransferase class I/II-fold pyridoxal phosphate-dependent enzyme [Chloroflexota bacterium]|nr:aminotransferase class I/II-fold pyridoxal phosphate-dependent enzyme [Chloroflexota bacterium]MDE3192159.1 aminotransferase class I/II-fold pyridoxal phosphate-dependent enzyme [Chloroflexota bacterium]